MFWSIFMLWVLRCHNIACYIFKKCEFASKCTKELISALFITLVSNWYNLDSKEAMANILQLFALTSHPNELKCISKLLEMSSLTKSKSECKSGTWSTSCILMFRARLFTHVSNSIDFCIRPLPCQCHPFTLIRCHVFQGSRIYNPSSGRGFKHFISHDKCKIITRPCHGGIHLAFASINMSNVTQLYTIVAPQGLEAPLVVVERARFVGHATWPYHLL